MMTGAMLVMGACVFGGLTAVLLMALLSRTNFNMACPTLLGGLKPMKDRLTKR